MALVAGGGAIVVMGSLTAACGNNTSPAPSSTTTTTTTTAPSPTEKNLTPGGANSFSPTVKAPPAPTAIPGTHNNN